MTNSAPFSKKIAVLAACALMLAGCGSYEKDLHTICNAPKLSGNENATGLAEVGPWLEKNVRTSKGRAFLTSLAGSGSVDAARAEVAAHGIAPCPLLDPHPQEADLKLPH